MAGELPDFQARQKQWTSHFRQPDLHPAPSAVEDRRLQIYRELLYKNLEGFISNAFPVLRKITPDKSWHALVRDFMHKHRCQSPYFLEIAQEFLSYLEHERKEKQGDFPFLLELAHYEWVEIALDTAETDLSRIPANSAGPLLEEHPLVSPLAWSLTYSYPVHKIGLSFQPQQPPEVPTWLIVYRNRSDTVKFMQVNAVTARMLYLLNEDATLTGRQMLRRLAAEIEHPHPEQVLSSGKQTLEKLRDVDIILGT